MEDLTIKIYKASDEGYFYDIFTIDAIDIDDETQSEDGGQCTSEDIRDCIEMACEHAKRLVVDLDNKINE